MNDSKYVITQQVIAGREIPQIEIQLEEFSRIKKAKDCLLNAIAVEEKIGYVIENYRELELELMREALDDMLFRRYEWNEGIDKLHRVSRRIVNLLSTTRGYIDHIEHHLSQVFGNPSTQLENLRTEKSKMYDSSLAYRTMEALRNFVQHRQLPIGKVTGGARWIALEKAEYRMHTVSPKLLMRDLDDEKFKRKVFDELVVLNKKEIELKPFIEEYLESLLTLHKFTREMLTQVTTDAAAMIGEAIQRFRSADSSDATYVDVVHLHFDRMHWIAQEGVPLINDWAERLARLEKRIRPDMRFTEQFATSVGKGREPTVK